MDKIVDQNVKGYRRLVPPIAIKMSLRLSAEAEQTVQNGRNAIKSILDKKDKRKIIITGPCSVHDTKAALEFAAKLKKLSVEVSDEILIVMRTYFEKPRTTVGWKGLIYDPMLNDSFLMEEGLTQARNLLLQVSELGLPCGTEFLGAVTPQYVDDLISWAAIGARTIESPTHREMASGLTMPVGFKNATTGDIDPAVNAVVASRASHSFIGVDHYGYLCVIDTLGNKYGHVVLRGGDSVPNCDEASVKKTEEKLAKLNLPQSIIVDCSHGNSGKKHERQEEAYKTIISQIENGNTSIAGWMFEANLEAGNQKINPDKTKLKYGQSVTDECISWDVNERLIRDAYKRLKALSLKK